MKKLTLLFSALFLTSIAFSQDEVASGGSLIADIMNVETVNVALDEGHEEARAEYEKEYEKNSSALEDRMTKLNETYKKDVLGLIEEFTKVLGEGEQKYATNKKRSVSSRIRTLSMTLKKDKKEELQNFNNTMVPLIREMPEVFHAMKTKELKDKTKEDTTTYDAEFKANLQVLDAFKKKEHLVIKPMSETDTSSEQ